MTIQELNGGLTAEEALAGSRRFGPNLIFIAVTVSLITGTLELKKMLNLNKV